MQDEHGPTLRDYVRQVRAVATAEDCAAWHLQSNTYLPASGPVEPSADELSCPCGGSGLLISPHGIKMECGCRPTVSEQFRRLAQMQAGVDGRTG